MKASGLHVSAEAPRPSGSSFARSPAPWSTCTVDSHAAYSSARAAAERQDQWPDWVVMRVINPTEGGGSWSWPMFSGGAGLGAGGSVVRRRSERILRTRSGSVTWSVAWGRRLRQSHIPTRCPVAKGQVKRSKNNKPKLTVKEKAAKKQAKLSKGK